MAIRKITKQSWPELKKLLRHDGYLFVAEALEESWIREEKFHDMIYELTAKCKELEDKAYYLDKTLTRLLKNQ